jgi:hypothetical protein
LSILTKKISNYQHKLFLISNTGAGNPYTQNFDTMFINLTKLLGKNRQNYMTKVGLKSELGKPFYENP